MLLIPHSSVNVSKHGQSNPMPKLHSFYLPFKTQHRILTVVQTILEECCFDFGKTWVPRLMKEHKWDEPESIELTQWIRIFSKHTKDLPTSATRSIAGKSLRGVLFGTSSLRHAAVHRVPTPAAELVNMLRAAHSFTTALNDPMRAIEIERIKVQLSLIIADVNPGLRCDSYVSSFHDQMAKFECEISAQNHEEDAGDFRNGMVPSLDVVFQMKTFWYHFLTYTKQNTKEFSMTDWTYFLPLRTRLTSAKANDTQGIISDSIPRNMAQARVVKSPTGGVRAT